MQQFSAAFHIWEKLGVRSLLSLKRFLRFIFIFGTNGAVFATDAQWRPRPQGPHYKPDLRNLVAASPTKFGRVHFELEKHRMEGPVWSPDRQQAPRPHLDSASTPSKNNSRGRPGPDQNLRVLQKFLGSGQGRVTKKTSSAAKVLKGLSDCWSFKKFPRYRQVVHFPHTGELHPCPLFAKFD